MDDWKSYLAQLLARGSASVDAISSIPGALDQMRRNASIGNLTSSIDSAKRIGRDYLASLLSNPGELADRFGAQIAEDASNPANRESMLNTAQGFAPIGMAGVVTYHGTPHSVDAYDLSKVGTGQGAQSYGHGIYFAENPATAQSYSDMLGGVGMRYPTGEIMDKNVGPGAAQQALNYVHYLSGAPGVSDPIQKAIDNISKSPSIMQDPKAAVEWLRNWKDSGATFGKLGKMYQQDLPDEVLPRMLQWDKPLSEQTQLVKDALSSAIAEKAPTYGAGTGLRAGHPYRDINSATGEQLYSALGGADALQSLGIPGVSYLDAGSRYAGQGTMNHVIWDQELLNRMKPQPVESP
jgi:hypothetical protein